MRCVVGLGRERKILIVFLSLLSVVKLVISLKNGLGVDEAHYVLYGRHLDLSYFDHPPLVGWVHFIFQSLFPAGDYLARLPAILNSLLTSYLLLEFLRRRQLSSEASYLAVIALNLTPLFNGLSLMLLPDSLLMPLGFLIVKLAEDSAESRDRQSQFRAWLGLGLCLGLAGLTKYTAILFVPALAIYFLQLERWRKLFTLPFLSGVALAALVVSPVLIWNMQNHFVSFSYQSGHVLNFKDLSLLSFVQSWLGQLLAWGLALGILAFWPLFKSKSFMSVKADLAQLVALLIFVFFVVVSFSQPLLPHWPAQVFVFLIPLAVAQAWDLGRKRLVGASLLIAMLLTLPLLSELALQWLPGTQTALLYRDIRQWKQVIAEATQLQQELPSVNKGIAVFNWTLGSRALYYAPQGVVTFVLDGKNHQFEFWNKASPLGFSLILAIEDEKIEETLSQIRCESVEKVGQRKSLEKNVIIHSFSYFRCLNYLGLKL